MWNLVSTLIQIGSRHTNFTAVENTLQHFCSPLPCGCDLTMKPELNNDNSYSVGGERGATMNQCRLKGMTRKKANR